MDLRWLVVIVVSALVAIFLLLVALFSLVGELAPKGARLPMLRALASPMASVTSAYRNHPRVINVVLSLSLGVLVASAVWVPTVANLQRQLQAQGAQLAQAQAKIEEISRSNPDRGILIKAKVLAGGSGSLFNNALKISVLEVTPGLGGAYSIRSALESPGHEPMEVANIEIGDQATYNGDAIYVIHFEGANASWVRMLIQRKTVDGSG
jgi:membrane protein implicated in regulation of membrane protease activity